MTSPCSAPPSDVEDDEWSLLLLDIYDALLLDHTTEEAKRLAVEQLKRIRQAWEITP